MLHYFVFIASTDTQKQVLYSTAGAIVGALLAFSLVLVKERIERIRQRKATHYHALVKLNRLLNLHAKRIQDNVIILPNYAGSLRRGEIYYNTLFPIEFDLDILINLHNLKLENALYTYFDTLSKDNYDISNLESAADMMKKSFINGSLSEESYRKNASYLADNLEILSKRLEEVTLKVNASALASVNDLIERDVTLGMKIDQLLVGQKKFEVGALEKESKKIYQEYINKIKKIRKTQQQ